MQDCYILRTCNSNADIISFIHGPWGDIVSESDEKYASSRSVENIICKPYFFMPEAEQAFPASGTYEDTWCFYVFSFFTYRWFR